MRLSARVLACYGGFGWCSCCTAVSVVSWVCFFFFFQAEDGIRDTSVTGVQTCALPISPTGPRRAARAPGERIDGDATPGGARYPRHRTDRGDGRAGGTRDRQRDLPQIGRASCRERVESAGAAGVVKKQSSGCVTGG